MRVRTEDKRREIIGVASDLFQELGYDRTSMSLISQRLGGSKATLYGYFKSKEELFLATIDFDISANAERLTGLLINARTLREGLIGLGAGYLERRLAPKPISNTRIVATQPAETGIGKTFYNNLLRPAWQQLADRFEIMMDEGKLRRADPWTAAMHWRGLLEGDLVERRLLGAIDEADPDEIERQATSAADVFLQIYGANTIAAAAPKPQRKSPAKRPRAKSTRRATTRARAAGK